MRKLLVCAAVGLTALGAVQAAYADAWDPPAGFYDSATGTGATLKSQLTTIMSSGHIQRRYGDYRYAAAITDADPDVAGRILLVYNRASVPATWDSGSTWNREHVWPQSLQPGSASNSSKGNLGDPHALRPCNPSINSSRSNKPFGLFATTGNYRSLGTYWFAGDTDKGDIARCLFYSATRWSSLGLTLVYGTPGSNQMGDLDALLRWNYTDPPDEFERRRNHAIYSSTMNPSYYTNNRNAYVDRPEFVWSVFGPGFNDSTLYFGSAPATDGGSTLNINFGVVLTGAPLPSGQNVALHKDGLDPTYYNVTTTGDALSSINGRYNTFDYNPQSTNIFVELDATTAVAGLVQGQVTIDNLDVTTGGLSQGSDDANDVITLDLQVLDHAQPSFSPSVIETSTTAHVFLAPDAGVQTFDVDVYNFDFDADQALLDLDAISTPGAPFGIVGGLPVDIEAAPAPIIFSFDTTGLTAGTHSTSVMIDASDEDLPGELVYQLDLTLEVEFVGQNGDWNNDGVYDAADVLALEDCLQGPTANETSLACRASFDIELDADVDLRDVGDLQVLFGQP